MRQKKSQFSVRITSQSAARIDAIAEKSGLDRTAVIQIAVNEFLERHENKPKYSLLTADERASYSTEEDLQ